MACPVIPPPKKVCSSAKCRTVFSPVPPLDRSLRWQEVQWEMPVGKIRKFSAGRWS